MECINLVDHNQLLCPWFTVVFVLFPRPIVNQGGRLFWILSDSNASLEEQIVSFDGQSSFFLGFVKYGSIVAKD
jgi:hypothetical protein